MSLEDVEEDAPMVQAMRTVPIEHEPAISEIDAQGPVDDAQLQLTLLDLVAAISEVTDCERELVATVLHMLRSGRVQITAPEPGTRTAIAAD